MGTHSSRRRQQEHPAASSSGSSSRRQAMWLRQQHPQQQQTAAEEAKRREQRGCARAEEQPGALLRVHITAAWPVPNSCQTRAKHRQLPSVGCYAHNLHTTHAFSNHVMPSLEVTKAARLCPASLGELISVTGSRPVTNSNQDRAEVACTACATGLLSRV